jgi:hypothetical protein
MGWQAGEMEVLDQGAGQHVLVESAIEVYLARADWLQRAGSFAAIKAARDLENYGTRGSESGS